MSIDGDFKIAVKKTGGAVKFGAGGVGLAAAVALSGPAGIALGIISGLLTNNGANELDAGPG